MKSLVYSIEDDKDIGAIINKTLEKAGYEVKTFVDGESFFKTFAIRKPEIILLDLMLPKMSGTDILKKIREDENNEEIRIIVISAKHLVMDKVECLDLGADDYIEKPFDLLELIARVDSKKRRIKKSDKIEIGKIVLNRSEHKVFIDQRLIDLTKKEYELLIYLIKNENIELSVAALYCGSKIQHITKYKIKYYLSNIIYIFFENFSNYSIVIHSFHRLIFYSTK